MEKHKCKICNRHFANGKAMGGHMRSHLAKLPVPPKPQQNPHAPMNPTGSHPISPSSSSSSQQVDQKSLMKGKSAKSLLCMDSDCCVVHDRESGSESPKSLTRRRSIRTRKSITAVVESPIEHETASSVSNTMCEEDLALCLMMLSREKYWSKQEVKEEGQDVKYIEYEDDDDVDNDDGDGDGDGDSFVKVRTRTKAIYKCETCKKVFRSYQALGGHRASHKKMKTQIYDEDVETNFGGDFVDKGNGRRIFECPFCFKVFNSGQALGGHKKVHLSNAASSKSFAKFGDNLIDLNLPAPVEEEEDSTVSNAEVFYQFK